jgi:hypothetical protein
MPLFRFDGAAIDRYFHIFIAAAIDDASLHFH